MSSRPIEGRCAWFDALLETLQRRFGLLPTRHQQQMLFHLVPTLARESMAETPERYVDLLAHLPVDNALVQNVVRALTIKESYFFRDPSTIESLRARVLPELLSRARETRVLRIWSAGSSTGEELYTMAVLLDELLPDDHGFSLRLVGTDIDTDAIERARAGVYGAWSLRTTTPSDVARVFERVAHGYRIKDAFRANVTFEPHNLADPHAALPAPGEFDLVFCRNVSIYFVGDAIAALHKKLRAATAPNGFWVASPSDPVPSAGWVTNVLPGMLLHQPGTTAKPSSLDGSIRSTPSKPPSLRPAAASRTQPVQATSAVGFAVRSASARTPPAPIVTPPSAVRAASGDGVHPDRLARVLQYANDGNVVEALATAQALALEYPLNANVHRLLALLHEEQRQIEQAISAWRRVLYLAPDDVDAYLRLGLLLGRAGDRPGAVRALRNAVIARERSKLSPDGAARAASANDETAAEMAARLLQRIRGGAS